MKLCGYLPIKGIDFYRDKKVIRKHINKVFADGGGYFYELLNRIKDIRSSEKVLYRQQN